MCYVIYLVDRSLIFSGSIGIWHECEKEEKKNELRQQKMERCSQMFGFVDFSDQINDHIESIWFSWVPTEVY